MTLSVNVIIFWFLSLRNLILKFVSNFEIRISNFNLFDRYFRSIQNILLVSGTSLIPKFCILYMQSPSTCKSPFAFIKGS